MTFVADDGRTVDVNEAACKMYGYQSVGEMLGRPAINRISSSRRNEVTAMVKQRLNGGKNHLVYETIAVRKDGTEFPALISSKRMVIADSPITSIFIMDITERKKSEERILRLAYFDQLTDLPNRIFLMEVLEDRLRNAVSGASIGSVLLIDLDNFRILNETLGHDVGDSLLKQIAVRLTSCITEENLIARRGGDEFLIFINNEPDAATNDDVFKQALSVGSCILKELNKPFFISTHEIQCTSSIGITAAKAGNPASTSINEAEIAMYHAKRHGRNTVQIYDESMQEAIFVHAEIEKGLKIALDENQFTLFYQIQVDQNDHPVGAEALIRWEHPTRGLLFPDQFIPIAEETEIISLIGKWLIDAACCQISTWGRNPSTSKLALSINVSPKQFHKPEFASLVIDRIRHYDIDPRLLKLELTETALLDNTEEILNTFTQLSEIGVQFSLDDFGTGYSSLQYLTRLPLNQLKIDKFFVCNITESTSALAIVQTIIAMSRSLNMEVIAEGVETEEIKELLLQNGCRHFQGYLFGRPEPAEKFEELLPTLRNGADFRGD